MVRCKQYGALPYIATADGVEICLVTSRENRRWIVPKGWPQQDLAPYELAALEAFEEAGLSGQMGKRAIGTFYYWKRLCDASEVRCVVSVYPMLVKCQALDWPERQERTALWAPLGRAARLVDDSGLANILRRFSPDTHGSEQVEGPESRSVFLTEHGHR